MKRIETGSFLSSGRRIDFRYSRRSDTLWLREHDAKIAYSRDTRFGIVDHDSEGNIVGLEILAASKALPEIERMIREESDEAWKPDLAEDLRSRVGTVPSYVSEAREHVKIG